MLRTVQTMMRILVFLSSLLVSNVLSLPMFLLRLTCGLRVLRVRGTECTTLEAEPRLVRDIHCYLMVECHLGLIGAGFSGILADEFDRRSLIETPH